MANKRLGLGLIPIALPLFLLIPLPVFACGYADIFCSLKNTLHGAANRYVGESGNRGEKPQAISRQTDLLTPHDIRALRLNSCYEGTEYRPVPVGVPAGEANLPSRTYRPAQPAQPATPPPPAQVGQPSKMLEDPDAQVVETSEEVWATDEAEATQKCEQIANTRTQEGGTLVTTQGRPQQVTRTPSKNGTFKFVCRLRSET